MDFSLIADFGTTNMKAGIVNNEGEILASKSTPVDLSRPEKGAVIHDPVKLYDDFCKLVKGMSAKYRQDIKTIVLSGYQFGFMPMDQNDRPLTGMITLLDTRSKNIMVKLQKELPFKEIYQKTGCPPLFTYIMARLFWLKQEKKDIFKKSSWFADIKSFLINKLCGKALTEPSMASVTQLFNLHQQEWDQQLLDLAGIDISQLPEVVSGNQIVGTISSKAADDLGLGNNIAIIPGVYDGGSMMIGMGGYDSSLGICNLGTTAMFRSCSTEPLIDDPDLMRMQTYCLTEDRYAIGGAINNAGVMLRWFRDNLSTEKEYKKIVENSADIPAGSEGLFCFPFLTGERDPRIGNLAFASLLGIKEYHSSRHVSRALLEGVGFSLNLIKQALEENNVFLDKVIIGGSGSKDDLWCQILADIFNLKIAKSTVEDSALIGGAILAATANGKFADIQQAAEAMIDYGKEFNPSLDNVKTYSESFSFYSEMLKKYQDIYRMHQDYYG